MVSLGQFKGLPVVLYSYPADDTPGCTREAVAFSASRQRLQELGAVVLGVSAQDAASHKAFKAKHNLNFPLLVDSADQALMTAYGFSTGVALNAIGLSRPMLMRQAIGLVAVLVLVLSGARWGLIGISVGRAIASGVIALLYLDLARRTVGFSWLKARQSVREAIPASIGCFAAAWAVGLLADSALPSAGVWAVLLVQSAAGALAFGVILLARGVSPKEEWAALRGRS